MNYGLDYAVAVLLIVFGALLIVACLRVGVEPQEVRPTCLK